MAKRLTIARVLEMDKTQFRRFLRRLEACPSSLDFIQDRTAREAFDACSEPEWIFWLLSQRLGDPGWLSSRDFLNIRNEIYWQGRISDEQVCDIIRAYINGFLAK